MVVIYDLGANNGSNLPYYLAKADKVVAVEANSDLCGRIQEKFAKELDGGSLVLENCAICEGGEGGQVPFYLHRESDVLSQLPKPSDSDLHNYECVRVSTTTIGSLIAEHGIPNYIKLDLESYDVEVLRSLQKLGIAPDYLSVEAHAAEVFPLLEEMGYKHFKLVDGDSVSLVYRERTFEFRGKCFTYSFPHHSAGPYGSDIDGQWMDADEFSRVLEREGFGWKDIHVSRATQDRTIRQDGGVPAMPLVSVVVPIHNVENYIRECAQSLMGQTLQDIEIIFVDDASPDRSLAILEEVTAGDDRVVILHNEHNMGVGASRNRGLSVARGEYVKIIDSDDYLSHAALEHLYSHALRHQSDIVFHDAIYCDGLGRRVHHQYVESHKPLNRMSGHASWWYLFRRQLLVEHPEITFPEGPHPHEDTTFSFMLFTYCKNPAYLPIRCIYYRQHDQMVTRRVSRENDEYFARSAVKCMHVLCEFYSGLSRKRAKMRREAFLNIAGYFSKYCKEDEVPRLLKESNQGERFKRFLFRVKITRSKRHLVKVMGVPLWFSKRPGIFSRWMFNSIDS